MQFAFGFLIGSLIAYAVSYLFHRKSLKRATADAEASGIQKGAILESELGWSKKKKQ
jgi:hypothetical protein